MSNETRGVVAVPDSAADGVVEVVAGEDGTVVRLAGEIDAAVGDALSAVDIEALAGSAVTIDLSGVTFLDSVGISFLVRLATQAKEQGRRVALTGAPPAVTEVLALVGASALFAAAD